MLLSRSLVREEGGAVAIMLALMLAALFGMLSLAMDLGKAWNLQTELQHAADASALAGVTQLDGTDGARVRAIQAVISELANNRQRFANDSVDADSSGAADDVDIEFDTTITIDAGTGKANNRDIKFYTILPVAAANESTTDADARFIEVNVLPRTATFSFAAVIGAVTSASPRARARRLGEPLLRLPADDDVQSGRRPGWRSGCRVQHIHKLSGLRRGHIVRRPRHHHEGTRGPTKAWGFRISLANSAQSGRQRQYDHWRA